MKWSDVLNDPFLAVGFGVVVTVIVIAVISACKSVFKKRK